MFMRKLNILKLKKKFRSLRISEDPFPDFKISKKDAEILITYGYDILKNHRDEYNRVLEDREMFGGFSKSLKFKVFSFVFCIILVSVFTDCVSSFLRFPHDDNKVKKSITSYMLIYGTYIKIK